MSEQGSEPQNGNQESFWKKTKNFFEDTWNVIKVFFEEMGKFFSRNKYKFGLFLGALTIAGAITASVFFGPALYTAITGLLPAVIPGLAAITTGLAATIPFVALAIIAATVLTAFALGLYFTISSARSLKPQIELSENQNLLDSNQQTFDPNQQTFDPNQQTFDPNQPLLGSNQKKKDGNEISNT